MKRPYFTHSRPSHHAPPVIAAVKKTGHTRKNKPYTVAVLGIRSRSHGLQLLGDYGSITSDTARGHYRKLGSEEVEALLGISIIEGVNYTGTACRRSMYVVSSFGV